MLRPFILLLIAVSFSVTGEILLKAGMNKVGVLSLQPSQLIAGLFRTFTNPFVLGGFVLVFCGSIFWLAVLSRVQLSWAYPLISISYVLGVLGAWIFLGEAVGWTRLAGVLVIVSGVFLVYRS